ncbi:polysaccharide deacetylase family protein [Gracilinema caldarium]|uniref:Polysaccharide deacetylase n=1 Tax=Gracilinema caldarium (strain ATCC 51460 / DSM 7334 / H1) TaxID=744872 RepID=F8F2N2_GRAC1|nr:polysaccharide deacetylase family protein [Gracilinema caldarium]AEJ19147.1 polysaccharide deacetylase [Gracilinema caldarium DSM 7334]
MYRNSVLLLLLLFIIAPWTFSANNQVIILVYHTFLGAHTSSLDFSKEEFIQQLDKIAQYGFHWVSLDDAVAGNVQGSKNIVMTIDDGNHSVPSVVTDVLLPRHIVPTLFISAKLAERSKFAFRPEVVKQLSDLGCIIGAHGFTHQYVTKKAFESDPQRSRDEIEKPGPLISQWTGKAVPYFALPFGASSDEARQLLIKAGYSYAFLAKSHIVPVDFTDPQLDHYAVPRTIVYRWNINQILAQLEKLGAKP